MRILHTSDWHIGKKTENTDRLPEQRDVLAEIIEIADREKIDVVLVAGDIFDTYVPSAEAEEVFFENIVKLARGRAAVIIPGNHDDATRLCAAGPLGRKHGVYFSGSIYKAVEGFTAEGSSVRVTDCGEGYICFEDKGGEEVYFGLLPYPTEARFKERSDGESYAEKIEGWLNKCLKSNVKALPQVVVSHLFTVGGIVSDGEREISLGGAKAIKRESFPDAAYTALGHLHKRQVVDGKRNIIYSGSILQYAFDEINIEKSVTVFEIKGGKITDLKECPLTRGKKLARVSARGFDEAMEMLEGYGDCWVELTLKLSAPLTREENNLLRSAHPCVIAMRLDVVGSGEASVYSRREMSDKKLFEECYIKQFGVEPEEELVSLYLEILSEVEHK